MNNGAIKKIDELGRIVIPKEIRKRLSIRSFDNLEISIDDDKIRIVKAVAIKNYDKLVVDLAKVIADNTNLKILATNRVQVLFNNTEISDFDIHKFIGLSLFEISSIKNDYFGDCDLRPIIIDSNVEGLVLVKGALDNTIVGQIINILLTSKLDITC